MSKILAGIPIILVFCLAHTATYGQSRAHCGFVDFADKLRESGMILETEGGFEQWMKQRKDTRIKAQSHGRTKESVYKVPIVVHVIHNGEALGTGANIPDAQIISQIKVLNDDFRRLNADTSSTPGTFKPLAAGMNIQFTLAKRTPWNGATTGIVRVNGGQKSWGMHEDSELKALSYWPSEDYLNIWVCNLEKFLGYAQFPVSDLPGLEGSPDNRFTDGVVIWHESFGSIQHGNFKLDPAYNLGRTVTHEVGHFFGLRHIWGDFDDCLGTDYVDDTPKQETNNEGCPTHPHSTCSPAVVSMFQNYMDYSNDVCLNLFTAQQIGRMETVIENSPRRASLLHSDGILPPEPVANDIGFRSLVSPRQTECNNKITPAIKIANFGKNNVTSAKIIVKVNGALVETRNVLASLNPNDSLTVTFSELIVASGENIITFEIVLTNGVSDGDNINNNNVLNTTVIIPNQVGVPFLENFSSLSQGWTVENENGGNAWASASVSKDLLTDDVMSLSLGSDAGNASSNDLLFTPVLNLSGATNPVLYFDYAYATDHQNFFGTVGDNAKLMVVAVSDCEAIDAAPIIFEKTGRELATQPTYGEFVPNAAADWTTMRVDLSAFADHPKLQLAFIGVNEEGNKVFLDNVIVASGVLDVKLAKVISPSLVTCDGSAISLAVENTGNVAIGSLVVNVTINNGSTNRYTLSDLDILPGQGATLNIPNVQFNEGQNTLEVSLSEPNGLADAFAFNNRTKVKVVIDETSDRIPLRQNFDDDLASSWRTETVASGVNFRSEKVFDAFGKSIGYAGFTNTLLGDEAWLVSPLLDLSHVSEASVQFDISNAATEYLNDFKVLVSKNCGNTYEEVYYVAPVAAQWPDFGWKPDNENDWVNSYIDLTQLAGNDSVRIAWVNTNAGGNNVYLDNFEFFVSKDQREVAFDNGYNIFGYDQTDISASALKIGFNLATRQQVSCEILDAMGRVVGKAVWDDALNQILPLPLENVKHSGSYLVRVNISGKYSVQRLLVLK